MTMRKFAVLAALVGGTSACGSSAEPINVVRFEASAVSVARGRPVNLVWTVENADAVSITAAPNEALVTRSPDPMGSVLSPPVTRTRVFILEAFQGDTSVRSEITVTALDLSRDVTVEEFTATPPSIEPGGTAQLSWRFAAATGGNIATAEGAVIAAEVTVPTGVLDVSPTETTTYIVSALGVGGPMTAETTVVVERPTIDAFLATPLSINEGDVATLSWITRFADTIVIRDGAGNEVVNTQNLADQVMVSPIETTDYTLTASNNDGLNQRATVRVSVNTSAVAEVRSFTASPDSVAIGVVATLSWDVTGAQNGVEIDVDGDVILRTSNPRGTLDVTPAVDTTYRLTAFGQTANDSASTTVAVLPSPPAIQNFGANPNPAILNSDTRISWVTLGATSLTLRRGATTLFSSTDDVDSGAVTLLADSASVDLTLSVTNADGTTEQTLTITALPEPSIDQFDVSPLTFNRSANVTIDYATSNASQVELRLSGQPDPSFNMQTLTGTHAVSIVRSTLFELIASNAAASTSRSVLVSDTVGKIEPNDTPATAVVFPGGGGNTTGSLSPVGDIDFYRVDVVAGGNVRVDISGPGGCATDTFVDLLAPDGTTVLGSDDDDAVAPCSAIVPAQDLFATDLPAGIYYIRVSAGTPGLTGPYAINVVASAPNCGNGLREILNQEQCDEGAANSPTGSCSTTCTRNINVVSVITAPGSTTIPGALSTPTDVDFYQINVPSPALMIARTYAPAAPDCNSDTRLVLYDDNFDVLGENAGTLVDTCSLIHPLFDGHAILPVGTYYLAIEEAFKSTSIAAYQLQLELSAPGCGNRIIEAGETCDDGNTTGSDGCSSSCDFEGELELEPNHPIANAQALNSSVRALGRIEPAGDSDFYRVTVPAGWSLSVDTYDPYGTCLPELDMVDAEVLVYDPTGLRLGSDDDSGIGRCAQVDPVEDSYAQVLSGGQYTVEVRNNAGTETGDYRVDIRTVRPACGNAIVELARPEQCDDGNSVVDDGCDVNCNFELVDTITSSVAASPYNLSFAAAGNFRVVAVDVQTAGPIAATTAPCTSSSLELISSTGSVLETRQPTAAVPCPSFNSGTLAVGRYFVKVGYTPLEETSPPTGASTLNLSF